MELRDERAEAAKERRKVDEGARGRVYEGVRARPCLSPKTRFLITVPTPTDIPNP